MIDFLCVFKFMVEYYELGVGFGFKVKKLGLEWWLLNRILSSFVSIWFLVMFIF